MATSGSFKPDEEDAPKADFSTITTEEIIGELKNRFQMYVFFGVPNDGEEHASRSSYKAANNIYEVFGMLDVCREHFREGMFGGPVENLDEDDSEETDDEG